MEEGRRGEWRSWECLQKEEGERKVEEEEREHGRSVWMKEGICRRERKERRKVRELGMSEEAGSV